MWCASYRYKSAENNNGVLSKALSDSNRKSWLKVLRTRVGKTFKKSDSDSKFLHSTLPIILNRLTELICWARSTDTCLPYINYFIFLEPTGLPESKYLRVGNKNFYFDIGSNNRGIFLRISEVQNKKPNKFQFYNFILFYLGSS